MEAFMRIKLLLFLCPVLILILFSCATDLPEFESSISLEQKYAEGVKGADYGTWGPVAYPLPESGAITVHRTQLEYGTTIDVYIPEEAEGRKLPVIILPRIFTRTQDRNHLPFSLLDGDYTISWSHLLASQGYVVIGMESDSPFNGFMTVMDYIRENAKGLRIDTDRIGFWAISSNPGTVMMYLARPDTDKSGMKAGAFLYSPLDSVPFPAIEHISYFIATGDKDDPALNKSAMKFVNNCRANDIDMVYMHHPEGGHGFDYYQDDETTRVIITELLNFLGQRL
jgi:hypothetical protein